MEGVDLFILTFTPEVVLRYLQRVQSLAPLGYEAGGELGMGTVPLKNIIFTENFVHEWKGPKKLKTFEYDILMFQLILLS